MKKYLLYNPKLNTYVSLRGYTEDVQEAMCIFENNLKQYKFIMDTANIVKIPIIYSIEPIKKVEDYEYMGNKQKILLHLDSLIKDINNFTSERDKSIFKVDIYLNKIFIALGDLRQRIDSVEVVENFPTEYK